MEYNALNATNSSDSFTGGTVATDHSEYTMVAAPAPAPAQWIMAIEFGVATLLHSVAAVRIGLILRDNKRCPLKFSTTMLLVTW